MANGNTAPEEVRIVEDADGFGNTGQDQEGNDAGGEGEGVEADQGGTVPGDDTGGSADDGGSAPGDSGQNAVSDGNQVSDVWVRFTAAGGVEVGEEPEGEAASVSVALSSSYPPEILQELEGIGQKLDAMTAASVVVVFAIFICAGIAAVDSLIRSLEKV